MQERQEEEAKEVPSAGWLETASGWGSAAWNNATARNLAAGSASYLWHTVVWMTRYGSASMDTLHDMVTKPAARKVAGDLYRLLKEWSPVAAAGVAASLFGAWGTDTLAPAVDGLFPGAATIASWGTFFPELAVAVWSCNRMLEYNLHASIVAGKTPAAMQGLRLRVPFKTCENPFDYDVVTVFEEGLPEALEPNKLYLRLIDVKDVGRRLAYSVVTPKGESVRDQVLKSMPVPEPFMKETVAPLFGAIFEATAKREHTLPGTACGGMRRLKGSLIMEPGRFWASEIGLRLVNFVFPTMQIPVMILRLFHNGRFLLGEVLTELCYRHKDTYYREHPELTLSLGLMHFLAALGIAWCLSVTPGLLLSMVGLQGPDISVLHFLVGLQQIMLVIFVMLASHMTLPDPVKHSSRPFWLDPMFIWYSLMGFEIDAHVGEAKKRIEAALKAPKDPNGLTLEQAQTTVNEIISSRPLRMFRDTVLPKPFRSPQDFIEDPFVREVWPGYRDEIIERLRQVEAVFASWATQMLTWKPRQAAHMISWITGIKFSIVYPALKFFGNDKARLVLGDIRRFIEGLVLRVEEVAGVSASSGASWSPDAPLPSIPDELVTPAVLAAAARQAQLGQPGGLDASVLPAPSPSSSSSSAAASHQPVSPGSFGVFGEALPLPSAADLHRAQQRGMNNDFF